MGAHRPVGWGGGPSVVEQPRRVHHPAKTVGEDESMRVIGVAGDPEAALVMESVMPRTDKANVGPAPSWGSQWIT